MPAPPRRRGAGRASVVLATSEARRTLPATSREFAERGASAEPVFFGAHRKPAGVMLPYELYLLLLDQLDDLAAALEIRRRDRSDDGSRVTLDELFEAVGLDREAVQAEVDAEDEDEAEPN